MGAVVDLHANEMTTALQAACARGSHGFLPLGDLGIAGPLVVDGRDLHSVAVYPVVARTETIGALAVWTTQRERLGPVGAETVARIANVVGLAIARELDAMERNTRRVIGHAQLDLERRVVEVGDSVVRLTPIECSILVLLVDARGRPVSRTAIAQHLTGSSFVGGSRSTDAHIKNLRQKLEREGGRAGSVVTVRSEGYAFRPPPKLNCPAELDEQRLDASSLSSPRSSTSSSERA